MRASYEVVVVGGGVVGLAVAWRARRRGLSVLVVEREQVAAGASSVAAGMLAPVSEADFGEEALLALNLDGAQRWPAFAAELFERSGVDVAYRQSGALVIAAEPDDVGELRRLTELQTSLGLDARWLGGRECRRLEPSLSPRVGGGIEAPHEGHVDPVAAVRALRAALEAEGGEVVEGVGVESIDAALDHAGRRHVGLTGGGSTAAEHVVVAAGAWSPALAPVDPPPVRPVKGQILTLRAPAGATLARRLIRTPRCYVVVRSDGRVVVGATTEERGFDRRVTAEGVYRLLEAAREVLPEVDELELVEARAGLRPATPDNAPLIGRSRSDGLLWSTGHGRHGVLLAPVTAEAVVARILGEEPPCDLAAFAPGRFGQRHGTEAARAGVPS